MSPWPPCDVTLAMGTYFLTVEGSWGNHSKYTLQFKVTFIALTDWFSTRENLVSWSTLGNTFRGYTLGGVSGNQWVKTKNAAKYPVVRKAISYNKELSDLK